MGYAMIRGIAAIALTVLLVLPVQAQERKSGPLGSQTGPYREQEWFIAWERNPGQVYLAHAKIYRPPGEEKRPLVLLAHGAPGNEHDRPKMKPSDYDDRARWFAAQGFVVVVPMRRGYGKSDGPYQESSGTCEKPNLVHSGQTMANDIRGVMQHMVKEPYVDPSRTIIVGQSAGGLASMAVASRNPPGVVAVINFAGGRRNRTASGSYCSFDALVEAAGQFGSAARVPALWIYTENDSFFDGSVSKPMVDAYRKGGAPVEYHLLPAFEKDGHALFHDFQGQRIWAPLVTDFLRRLQLMS